MPRMLMVWLVAHEWVRHMTWIDARWERVERYIMRRVARYAR